MAVRRENHSSLFIGGQWVVPATTDTFEVVSPFTEQPIGRVVAGSRDDMDRAVSAARSAFDTGPWPRMSLAERMAVLGRLGQAIAEHRGEIAALITEEMGCPITQTLASQAGAAIALIETNLELVQDYPWRTVRRSAIGNALVTREPLGVVAAVVPWNAPLSVAMLKLAPALLSGCTVILKPSPEAPLSAYLLAELVDAVGFPPGVLNIVVADRTESEYLVTHPGVDKVSFTGSTVAGRRIAALCGDDLRRYTLELGGKSAALVLDDADLDAAVASLRTLSFRYNGQACTNKTRVIVSRSRADELVERLADAVRGLRIGDPADPATEIGPLVSRRQRDRVEAYIAGGRADDAKVVVGGGRPDGFERGLFVEPTVFAEVTPDLAIAQEEIFGPVVAVLTCDSEDEAVAIANDTVYGLSGAVYSADTGHALAVAARLRTGSIEINGSSTGFHAPLGGFKHSGIGREAGLEGFDAFVEPKSYGISGDIAAALS
ncbi:aldehyde dehydrogenase [Nocardia fluminea]|uniref:aldehyde dehydrogenase n=1 Tax=Nocardia fluminea TaxID=134984 RepID=UPI00371216D8